MAAAHGQAFRSLRCARCREAIDVCTHCYRGQKYCLGCSKEERRERQQQYARTYRETTAGRQGNRRRQAARRREQREQRERSGAEAGSRASAEAARAGPRMESGLQAAVTHHGSPISAAEREVAVSNARSPVVSVSAATTTPLPELKIDASEAASNGDAQRATTRRCHFCGCELAARARRAARRRAVHRRGARPRIYPRP